MADLRAVNAKLRERAIGIVAAETGASPEEARGRLERAQWDIRKAIAGR
jgi:N-acetylmuramic acid 6-phosphate (MurNAc-6-P) etherase